MGYSKEIYDSACKVISSYKKDAIYKAEKRKKDFYKKCPRAAEIEKTLASTALKVGRAILNGNNTVDELTKLKENNLMLQKEFSLLLKANNLPEDYLEVEYRCKRCNDEGYIDGKMCDCMKKALKIEAYNRLNRSSPLSLCTFKSFSIDYYSTTPIRDNGPSPRKRMQDILNFCFDYASNFSPSSPSLLMMGGIGLGKTHLSLAIAREAINKGYGVIYGSAQNIVTKLEKERFRYNRDYDEVETEQYLINCDLFILDDLGTEFSTSFSNSAIYNIINTRIMMNKPTIISTNLSIKELEKNYTERLVSRIMGNNIKLEFLGIDIRQQKRIMSKK